MYKGSIGIFDSGIGGLTVASEIIRRLPNETITYIGDTARVPYGNRGEEVITKFALELARFLLSRRVKVLVVACNTISAVSLQHIKAISNVPVLDVISPASNTIVQGTKNNTVGIIGTRATITSKAYETELLKLRKNLTIYSKACPLFVPVVEEGQAESEVAKLLTKRYLSYFDDTDIDVLHLGCTHFPLLQKVIRGFLKPQVKIIDSANAVADELEIILSKNNLLNGKHVNSSTFYVTDAPEKVKAIAKSFFGEYISGKIRKVSL